MKEDKMDGKCCRYSEEGKNSVFVGKLGGRRPLGRPMYGWEDNIKMNLNEVALDIVDWISLAQDMDKCHNFCAHGNKHLRHKIQMSQLVKELLASPERLLVIQSVMKSDNHIVS
jgi:hypothetical protein